MKTRGFHPIFNSFYELLRIKNLILTDPLNYFDFMRLMKYAKLVMTDSGGIQEETTFMKIPCLTLRENTERPVTIEVGSNTLCALDSKKILSSISKIAKLFFDLKLRN